MTAWGIHRLADMIGSKDTEVHGGYRAVPLPYRGRRLKAAFLVLTGKAFAVAWPDPGDLERALRK